MIMGSGVLRRPHPKPRRGPETHFPLAFPRHVQAGWAGKAGGKLRRHARLAPECILDGPWPRSGFSRSTPGDPRGGDAGLGLPSRDFGARPAALAALLGQGKGRAGINGARPSPAAPARGAPGLPAGRRRSGAASPGGDGPRPRARPRHDRPLEAPRSPQAGGGAPRRSLEAPVTGTLLSPFPAW